MPERPSKEQVEILTGAITESSQNDCSHPTEISRHWQPQKLQQACKGESALAAYSWSVDQQERNPPHTIRKASLFCENDHTAHCPAHKQSYCCGITAYCKGGHALSKHIKNLKKKKKIPHVTTSFTNCSPVQNESIYETLPGPNAPYDETSHVPCRKTSPVTKRPQRPL